MPRLLWGRNEPRDLAEELREDLERRREAVIRAVKQNLVEFQLDPENEEQLELDKRHMTNMLDFDDCDDSEYENEENFHKFWMSGNNDDETRFEYTFIVYFEEEAIEAAKKMISIDPLANCSAWELAYEALPFVNADTAAYFFTQLRRQRESYGTSNFTGQDVNMVLTEIVWMCVENDEHEFGELMIERNGLNKFIKPKDKEKGLYNDEQKWYDFRTLEFPDKEHDESDNPKVIIYWKVRRKK